jgi:CBS domain-containing protein
VTIFLRTLIDYIRTDRRRARDLMSSPVVTASEDTPVSELADLMTNHRIKRLPIMREGMLVGVVRGYHPSGRPE